MKKMIPNNPAAGPLLSSDAVILQTINSILPVSLIGSTSATFSRIINFRSVHIYVTAVLNYK
jgi:hypothetical protein